MRRFSILHPLSLAYFSRGLYRDVAREWRGVGLGYLAILWCLFSLPSIFYGLHFLKQALVVLQPTIMQFPTGHMKDNHLVINKTSPYAILFPESHLPWFLFDLRDRHETPVATKANVLVTKDAIYLKGRLSDELLPTQPSLSQYMLQAANSIANSFCLHHAMSVKNTQEYTECRLANDSTFSPESVFHDAMRLVKNLYWGAELLYFFSIIELMFFAVLGWIFSRMNGYYLPFSALLRITAVAFTPSAVVAFVFTLTGLGFPSLSYYFFFNFTLKFAYVVFGILSNNKTHKIEIKEDRVRTLA